MKSLRESVAAIIFKDSWDGEILAIKRQNHLNAFPGYTSFPGGKVDKADDFERKESFSHPSRLINALFREVYEETGIDLEKIVDKEICLLGEATTPDFNPIRFHTYFFGICLGQIPALEFDKGEVASYDWKKASEWHKLYNQGQVMAVVPTLMTFEKLSHGLKEIPWDLNISYDAQREVPTLEVIKGLKQLLPLSNTFPPANRTNSFLIGDEFKVLVDPSPRDKKELDKFINTVEKLLDGRSLDLIFLTHHHPDHHEYADEVAKYFKCDFGMSLDTFQRIKKMKSMIFFQEREPKIFGEGDILTSSLSEDVLCFATPGHDEGQLSFAPRDLKWFMASDLFQTVGTVVVGGEEGDMKKYFESLKKVIALNPKACVPSHGLAVGGVYKLEKTLEHRKFRERKIKECLGHGMSEEEILNKIYEGLDTKLIPYALKTLKAHIKKINSQ